MTLQSSGAISLNDVHQELGEPSGTTVSFNDADVRALAGVPSGAISLLDFYGASSTTTDTFDIVVGTDSGNSNIKGYDSYFTQFNPGFGSISSIHNEINDYSGDINGNIVDAVRYNSTNDTLEVVIFGYNVLSDYFNQITFYNIDNVGTLTFDNTDATFATTNNWSRWTFSTVNGWTTDSANVSLDFTGVTHKSDNGFMSLTVGESGDTIGYEGLSGIGERRHNNNDTMYIDGRKMQVLSAYYIDTSSGGFNFEIQWDDGLGAPPKLAFTQLMTGKFSALERTYYPGNATYSITGNRATWSWPDPNNPNSLLVGGSFFMALL